MSSELPLLPADRRFDIVYDEFTGAQQNADFQGQGAFILRAGSYVFTGKPQASSADNAPGELVFASDQIWNVRVAGRRVQFATALGESGRRKQPFGFFCASPDEAIAVAQLLPQARDADFTAGLEFVDKWRKLGGATSPWTSVTHAIIAANVVVFLLMGLAGAGWIDVTSMEPYMRFGANRADVTTDGQWWRLVASMFLHYGVIHLALNMWALNQAGHLVERLYGRRLYALLYLGSGLAGSLATLWWHREHLIWSAGASGAVFGIYGGLVGYTRREHQALPKSVYQPLLRSTLLFAGYNLLYGLVSPNIDNAAHIGGFAGGALLGWLMALPVEAEARARLLPRRLGSGLVGIAVLVTVGVAVAPRYDYHFADGLALDRTNSDHGEKEKDLLTHQQTALTALADKGDRDTAQRWIADEALPFYSSWHRDVAALHLKPGSRAEEHRRSLEEILRLKVEAFERLQAALRRGDANALVEFNRAELKIEEAVTKLDAASR